ncbi:MAG TPA: hypothetical protein VGC87_04645 [Pyrinomonadaceae bacterium]
MHIFALKPSANFLAAAALALALAAAGCQQQTANSTNTTTTTNANTTANTDASNTSNANTTSTTTSNTSAIEAREPDQYSATITMKVEVTGAKNISTPPLTANFARNGGDRRISFKLGGDEVIYLDRADKHYVVLPNRKQYAEVDAQSTGFNVPTVMTPGQIIKQVQSVSGCEKVGDEQFAGRSAVKYRCAGAAKTGTQAGDVKAESFVYVDKDTGLPLRSETLISSQAPVAGASAAKVVTELSNIQTSVPADTFAEPAGMSKVDPAQVRSQVEAVVRAALFFVQNMMNAGSTPPAPAPTASPAASPAR